jgi:hypothetical protein
MNKTPNKWVGKQTPYPTFYLLSLMRTAPSIYKALLTRKLRLIELIKPHEVPKALFNNPRKSPSKVAAPPKMLT